jgi:hypothetical protein
VCSACGGIPVAHDIVIQKQSTVGTDPFSVALREPHRLLEPLRS